MKKILKSVTLAVLAALVFAVPALAYMPVHDQMQDIRWFDGYNPEKGLSVLSDTPKGVKASFKYDAQDMWANRVVCGQSYNLTAKDPLKVNTTADKEGVYVQLKDIKWDVPKATLSRPKPKTSIMITLSIAQGGWSDRPSLHFWIIRNADNTYQMAVLRGREPHETAGMTKEEETANFWAMDYTDLPQAIGSDINFYIRKTSATKWTLNINNNKVEIDDKTIMAERLKDMSAVYVSLGTWASDAAVECIVSELWSYGCIEYSKKVAGANVINPKPEFVQTVQKADAANNTSSTAPSSKGGTASTASKAASSQGTQGTASTESGDLTSEDTVSEDAVSGDDIIAGDSSSKAASSKAAATDKDSPNHTALYTIIAAIVIVVLGGGAAFYFLFMRKPAAGAPEGGDDGQ